ncbi:hypothetical protein GCM10011346_06790 [Oceanobacillus neutriphilus]|uniref:Antitoxin n=2 Tax=Oceanobacillus neutriphilus TaxID=531815 RepID=A0ABQ2NNZ9_9BACI|nr:hypothetical protein GCM10011346_06790 [Oceanobacillus neutriphilus]
MSDVLMKDKNRNLAALEFLQRNVLNVTDLTRTNKLSEILNSFSGEETDEVFVVKNHKNKDAAGVFVDLERYIKLLKIEEIYEKAMDSHMLEIAKERKDDIADIPLADVLKEDDEIDYKYIYDNIDKIDLED